MALTREDLAAISKLTSKLLEPLQDDMQVVKDDMRVMKGEIQFMKDDMKGMKDDMQGMKDDIQGMKDDIQGTKDDIHRLEKKIIVVSDKVTALQLHVENETDRGLQLLAENHVNLVNKLNEAIPVYKKDTVFEVEISSLKSRVTKLEDEVKALTA